MAKKVKLGSIKRFGPRYGRRNKEKVALLEKEHRRRRKCPYCNYVKVKRLSRGIWECDKCNAKFAGKAYTFEVRKKKSLIVPKVVINEDVEEMEESEELEETEQDETLIEEAEVA